MANSSNKPNSSKPAPVQAAPAAPAPAPVQAAPAPVQAAPAPVQAADAWYAAELAQHAANLAQAQAAPAKPAPAGPRPLSGPMAALLALAQGGGVTTKTMRATLPMRAAPPQTQVLARLARQVGGVVAQAPNGGGKGWRWHVVAPGGSLPPGAVVHHAYAATPLGKALASKPAPVQAAPAAPAPAN